MLEKDIQEVLFSEEQLKTRVNEIAQEIERDYAGKEIMLISVLRADRCRLPRTCLKTSPAATSL